MSDDRQMEAARMLDELGTRLYPSRRASTARALVIEQAIRAMYRRVLEQRES